MPVAENIQSPGAQIRDWLLGWCHRQEELAIPLGLYLTQYKLGLLAIQRKPELWNQVWGGSPGRYGVFEHLTLFQTI